MAIADIIGGVRGERAVGSADGGKIIPSAIDGATRWTPEGERRVFWTLQAVWWPASLVVYTTLSALHGSLAVGAWQAYAVSFGIAFASTFILRALYLATRAGGLYRAVGLLIALAFAAALAEILVVYQMRLAQMNEAAGMAYPVARLIWDTLSETWYLLCWAALYVVFAEHAELVHQRARLARAETLAREAQVAMLRFQLNPHFLFNTLNAISALVLEKRNDQAEAMLMGLSRFLRYSLDTGPEVKVRLDQELAAQRLYLDIEQERYGDRLAYEVDIAPGLDAALVPSLILQPLVENAIKHGVASSARKVVVAVRVRAADGELALEVADDGPGVSASDQGRRGIGLANTAERLQVLYGARAALVAEPADTGGFRAAVRLPLERAAKDGEGEEDA